MNVNSSGVSIVNDRQPSFKSPFGVNDPHLNHDEDPHAKDTKTDTAAAAVGGVFSNQILMLKECF